MRYFIRPNKLIVGNSTKNNIYFLFIGLFLLYAGNVNGEGTKELAPNSDDVTALYTNSDSQANFASYNSSSDSRLHIHLDDPANQQIFFGFSQQMNTSNGSDGNYLGAAFYYRVKDPNGNIVFGPIAVDASNANANTWTLAQNGPAAIDGTGYTTTTDFNYIPAGGAVAGDYYIEFSLSANSRSFNGSSPNNYIAIKFWDITVATRNSPTAIDGRVWSKNWNLRTPSISQGSDPTYTFYDRPFNGVFYSYTDEGFVNQVNFDNSGFRGLSFVVAFNQHGVQNTGNIPVDRRSVESTNSTFPQYKIFINDPDNSIYPSGVIGNVSTNPIIVDCDPGNLCLSYEVTEPGLIIGLLDFDNGSGAGVYDVGTADVLLFSEADEISQNLEGCIPWDGNDGLGNPINLNNTNIPIYLTYAQGITHFPMYDVEFNPNGYLVSPVRPTPPSGFTQEIYYDDTNIPDSPGTGIPQVEINGCIPGCHNYSNLNYGETNTINSWWYTSQDVTISSQMSQCILNAYNDTDQTILNTAVTVDVTANDDGDNIDPTTVSTLGLLQPSNGTTSVNSMTGEITYTPNSGFTGSDIFEYQVCDTGGTPCDTATVTITILCSASPGQNIIEGTVFVDDDSDGSLGVGESGPSGIDVFIYEDNNEDGIINVGDTLIDTVQTNGVGNFSVQVTPPFPANFTYNNTTSGTFNFQADCGTVFSRTFSVTDNFTVSDLNVGLNLEHSFRGDIGAQIVSPLGTSVIIIFPSADSDDNYNLLFDDSSGNPIDDDVAVDPLTPLYENNRIASPYNSLSAFNGENANGTWTLNICNINASGGSGGQIMTFNSAKLDFTSTGVSSAYYIMKVNQSDFPVGAVMSTDSTATAQFTATSQTDCANNFGYQTAVDISINKTVDNASPDIGNNIVFTVTATNLGPANATGIQVTDLLPNEFTYLIDDSGGNYIAGTGVWTIGDLTNGSSSTINITVTPNKAGTPTNTAQLTAIDQTDSNNGNDQSSVQVTINCDKIKAPLTLIKN